MSNELKKKLILATKNPSRPIILDYVDESRKGATSIEKELDQLEHATTVLMQAFGMSQDDATDVTSNVIEKFSSRTADFWTDCLLVSETPQTFGDETTVIRWLVARQRHESNENV